MIKETLLVLAVTGHIISPKTGVSIALVTAIVGGVFFGATTYANIKNDVSNLQTDMTEMKQQQKEILEELRPKQPENREQAIEALYELLKEAEKLQLDIQEVTQSS